MAYTTIALVRVASGLTNSTNVPDATITAKIGLADALINSKVGEIYALPFSGSGPTLLQFLSLEITTAMLMMNQYSEEAADTDKGWQKRLDWCMKQLEEIRTQKLKLYNESTGAEYARNTLKSPSSYPNSTSSEPDATDTTEPKVTMNQTF